MNKYIVIPNNLNNVNSLLNENIDSFLFPMDKYSIGYNSFTSNDLNGLKTNKYLLINRVLKTNEIDELINDLKDYKDIKGIFFEDIGICIALSNSNYELINYNNHFNTNYHVINTCLNLNMDSCVISNDLTKDEIEEILNNSLKPLVVFVYGKSNIMYSRRSLVNSFNEYYRCKENDPIIKEQVSKIEFKLKESKYGTIVFDNNYYDGSILINNSNKVLYYLINLVDLNDNEVNELGKILNNNELSKIKLLKENTNYGFLYTKTIYKVKGGNL